MLQCQTPLSTAPVLGGPVDHLGEVALLADFLDQVELGLEPVDRLFFVLEDVFEKLARAVVRLLARESDDFVEALHGGQLEIQVQPVLLDRIFLASLNDSNVAAIHEMEESDGELFLVLEYVPGISLADRLKKGSLPIQEALKVCCDLARGLEAAHAKGMIHRDLKPGNVQLTPDGKIKVLDFGLAKAFGSMVSPDERSQQMTVTAVTREHTVLGTVPYMSPEQASGQVVDKRTDIWAFGCILYELLTGERAFAGETVSNTLTKIQGQDPDWERLPAETPVAIRKLVVRCLEKDADRRLHDIADARIEIEEMAVGESPVSGLRAAAKDDRATRLAGRAWWALAGGLAGEARCAIVFGCCP